MNIYCLIQFFFLTSLNMGMKLHHFHSENYLTPNITLVIFYYNNYKNFHILILENKELQNKKQSSVQQIMQY